MTVLLWSFFILLITTSYYHYFLALRRLSSEVRSGVEAMWSTWGSNAAANPSLAPAVCPLTLRAGAGLRAGIVAHFNGSEHRP